METLPDNGVRPGRAYLLAGLAACLLGPALAALQLAALKVLATPWYSPALAGLGVLLFAVALARRPGVVRALALLVAVAFAGFQWYLLAVALRLPDYAGPGEGERLPPFRAASADGEPFTDADLRDGSRRVMVFFRGRW